MLVTMPLIIFVRRGLVCCSLVFRELGHQLFGGVENTIGLDVAHVAAFGLAVMLKGTPLTEVVSALCDDGILEFVSADEALEGHVLLITTHLVVLLIVSPIAPFI